ncbi:MAG: AAA family ATPase [Candidatus Sericytochromatia bacterium]
MNLTEINFWLLEADWRGGKEHIQRFLTEGIWFNLHSNKSHEFNKIKVGDYIAIKEAITKEIDNSEFISYLKIIALGVVSKNFQDGRRIEINWNKKEFEIEGLTKADNLLLLDNKEEIKAIFGNFLKENPPKIIDSNKTNIKKEEFSIEKPSDIIQARENFALKSNFNSEVEKNTKDIKIIEKKNKNINLNQIFYGLSGTGKTHISMLTALEIIDGFFPENTEEARRKFNYYKNIGQISMLSFHNSYKYEDFIEGIVNFISPKNSNLIENKIKDGIFKEISNIAKAEIESYPNKIDFKESTKFFKASIGTAAKEKDNSSINYCFENDYIFLDMLGGIDYSILEDTDNWEKAKEEIEQAYLYDGQSYDQKRLGIQSIFYFKNHMKKNDIILVSNDNEKIIGIASVKGNYEFKDLAGVRYNHFRKVDWIIKNCNIPVSKFYRKEFSEQPIYELVKRNIIIENVSNFISNQEKRRRNYVIIIDEINKGNIYNIFGEVLTLIESSKRIGKKDSLTIKLPYSGENFGVPDNLYIIGTMNSSDKKALLDQTIRRRFDFVKLDVDYSLLNFKIDGIEIDRLLQSINNRIEYLSDENNCIGHSYFMNLIDNPTFEQLLEIFSKQIIPLLEYNFDYDYEKISLILADNKKKNIKDKFVKNKDLDIKKLFGKKINLDNKKSFYIDIPKNPISYIKIYE